MTHAQNDPFGFGELEEDLSAVPTKQTDPKFARIKFTCESCGGSGLWRAGRANVHGNPKCNTCHGRGYLVTSPAARAKVRNRQAQKQAQSRAASQADNIAALGGEQRVDALRAAAEWSDFARSLYEWHVAGTTLTPKQVASANGMLDKLQARAEAKATEQKQREAVAPVVDLQPIRTMFETAVSNGHKRPKYRAEGLVISLAPAHGANAGALYVKAEDNGDYMGKVVRTAFIGAYAARGTDVESTLLTIAANPLEAALRYGAKTGKCACCGRALTNKLSVQLGIGPVCRESWGL